MKFGDTLYQRSVPKWSAYNFKYNEIKHLIKTQTSAGLAVPLDIPTQGKSRWEESDNRLFKLLQAEYDNVTLFLRSKQGEIERRLAHLEKQVKIAQRAVDDNALDKPIIQARKYRQLVRDSEDIGDEIQNLARFAGVQKTAFRKILKKYRKWTGSTSLQTRLDVEVFSSNKLQTDFSDHLQQLAELTVILTQELAGPMLTGQRRERSADRQQNRISASAKRSAIARISGAVQSGPLDFDAAVMTVPYGEAAGSAFYWVHPDNLDEARTLLLRHMRDASAPPTPTRKESETSLASRKRSLSFASAGSGLTMMVFFDNAQRFVKDSSWARPSRAALSAHWDQSLAAVVTLAGLSPSSSGGTILSVDRRDLANALKRESLFPNRSKEVAAIQHYLIEHRDVKPLAEVCSSRSRFIGMNNTADVANWATLDTSVIVSAVDMEQLGEPQHQSQNGEAFPYAILHIRWEFARTPAVVRAFDESHLVERVFDFTVEGMAIHTADKGLSPPPWRPLMDKDIRKVPVVPRMLRSGGTSRVKINAADLRGTSSGPSSSEGQSDGVFSITNRGYSSVTSEDTSMGEPSSSVGGSKKAPGGKARKKHARIKVPERDPPPVRYWNEFDDGDSDVNPDEGYAIYVDPDEPVFPGAETVSKAFTAMYESLGRGKSRLIAWLPLGSRGPATKNDLERAPLLARESTTEGEGDSSGSDTDELLVPAPHHPASAKRRTQSTRSSRPLSLNAQVLSVRQQAQERILFFFYSGLLGVAYVLLVMAGILLGAGRRKAYVEVDAGVLAGVIVAEVAAVAAMVLILLRQQRLSVLHWGIVGVLVAGVVVVGVALVALMFSGSARRVGKTNMGLPSPTSVG